MRDEDNVAHKRSGDGHLDREHVGLRVHRVWQHRRHEDTLGEVLGNAFLFVRGAHEVAGEAVAVGRLEHRHQSLLHRPRILLFVVVCCCCLLFGDKWIFSIRKEEVVYQ